MVLWPGPIDARGEMGKSIVQQDEQFERSVVALRRSPIRHNVAIMPFENQHVLTVDRRHVGSLMRLNRDYQMGRNTAARGRLLGPRVSYSCQKSKYR